MSYSFSFFSFISFIICSSDLINLLIILINKFNQKLFSKIFWFIKSLSIFINFDINLKIKFPFLLYNINFSYIFFILSKNSSSKLLIINVEKKSNK